MDLPKQAITREIGYAVASPGDFWMIDSEATPELRWPLSVDVFERMPRQDAQIASIMRAITLPIIRTGWRLDPNGARDEVVQLIADDLRLPILGADGDAASVTPRARGRFAWIEHVRMALNMFQYGHMFFEQVYRIDEQGRARLVKLPPRYPRSIAKINVERDGSLSSIEQHSVGYTGGKLGTVAGKPIPARQLVVYLHNRESGDWIGGSVLRPAYKNWLIKDRLLRVQAQTIERNGMGVPVYQAAERDTEDDMQKGLDMASDYRAGDSSAAALPYGAKLRLLGVEGSLPDAGPAIRYHDEQMARAVLAHFLNLGTQTGSWALGSTFADFFVMSLQSGAQLVADTANQHIVEDIVDLNWGMDEPAPRIVFDEIGSRHDATAEAMSLLLNAGAVIPDRRLEQALRTQFGLPPKDPESPDPAPQPESSPPPAAVDPKEDM